MKKLFTFCAACMASIALWAAETTLWTGDKAISWNGDEYAGEQFDTSSDPTIDFSGLKAEDTIRVYIGDVEEGAQFVLSYKAGDNWAWTDLEGVAVLGDTVMEYPVASDEIAEFIAGRGLIIKGIKFHAKRIAVAAKADEQPEDPQPLEPGETRVLWENAEGVVLSWNEICEQDAELGAQLAAKDQIIITVIAKNPETEWPKVILRDASSEEVTNELLNEVGSFPYEVVFTLTAEQAFALQNGFRISGDGVNVTKVSVYKYKAGDEPQPEEKEYVDTIVWTGDVAISWNQEVYAGSELDTYNVQQDMLAGVAKDDSIKIYYEDAIEGAQFALTYKAGEEWNWTDLVTSQHNGFFAYRVASDEIAQDIADHGLVVRGQGYHATTIVIGKPKSMTAIDQVNAHSSVLSTIRFNLMGQRVGENYKGVVIINGKKYIQQ